MSLSIEGNSNIGKVPSYEGRNFLQMYSGLRPGVVPDSFDGISPQNQKNKLLRAFNDWMSGNIRLSGQLLDESVITRNIICNPEISNILGKYGLVPVVETNNLLAINKSHIEPTIEYANMLAKVSKLPEKDRRAVLQAAMFHDYGKILIPSEILNKKGPLTPIERKIVDEHSLLGYELLKNSGLSKDVLYTVRNHHTPAYATSDVKAKILSIADIYSALTEKRAYKDAFSPQKSLEIMEEMACEGKIDRDLFENFKGAMIADILAKAS